MPAIALLIILSVAILAILFVLVLILLRTVKQKRAGRQMNRIEPAKVDSLNLAAHLAEVIQCQTVSMDPPAQKCSPEEQAAIDSNPFTEMHEILMEDYPLVSRKLVMERINDYSLLFTWTGSRPDLPAVLFAAHQDVVPVAESSLDQWDYPPFSGAIADGFVWGRGSMDIKNQLITLLDAAEYLLERDYQPVRTIYLAFGHDEEIGGYDGAKAIAGLLKERGVELGAMVDEGSGVHKDGIPGFNIPLALIGIGEKGHLTLDLSVDSAPGHSSVPTAHTGIGILARGITRLENSPMPASLDYLKPILKVLSPDMPFLTRMAFNNLWLFGGAVKNELAKSPNTNALMRTTTAVTMIEGGIKDNILPPHTAAKVNFRLIPGDSVEDVVEHVRRAVDDDRIKIAPPVNGRGASSISPADSQAYLTLYDTIRGLFGDLPIAPMLVTGATDARHYSGICRNIYRFTPVITGYEDANRVHGVGERISVENLERMQQFFIELMQAWSEAPTL